MEMTDTILQDMKLQDTLYVSYPLKIRKL